MPDPYTTSIIVPATSVDLTSLDAVKRELGVTNNDSDILLAQYISEQSRAVTDYCGREFVRETIADTFNLDFGTCNPLLLSRAPIVSITSITEASTVLDPAKYDVDYTGGRIWRLDGDVSSWWAVGKTVVTYVGGHDLALSRAVQRATIVLVKQAWYDRARDPRAKSESVDGVGSKSLWGEQVEYAGAMPAEVVGLLRPYCAHYV